MPSSIIKRYPMLLVVAAAIAMSGCVSSYSAADRTGGLMTIGDIRNEAAALNVALTVSFTTDGVRNTSAASAVERDLRRILAGGPVLQINDSARPSTLNVAIEHTPDRNARAAGTAAGASLGMSKRAVRDTYSFNFALTGTPGFDSQGRYAQSVVTTFGGKAPSNAQDFEAAFDDALESALVKFLMDVQRARQK